MAQGRRCTKCDEWKEWSNFYKRRNRLSGYRAQCKTCMRERDKDRRQQNDLLKKYNLEYGIWENMMVSQCGGCEICGAVGEHKMCVDHSHDTGEVRGLICGPCNSGIGMLQDDQTLVARAAIYLEVV